MKVYLENDIYIFNCPHCGELIIVHKNHLNCCIFRHGVYKENMKQINPHAPKELCDSLAKNNKIYGCGKPFKFIKGDVPSVEMCDYI